MLKLWCRYILWQSNLPNDDDDCYLCCCFIEIDEMNYYYYYYQLQSCLKRQILTKCWWCGWIMSTLSSIVVYGLWFSFSGVSFKWTLGRARKCDFFLKMYWVACVTLMEAQLAHTNCLDPPKLPINPPNLVPNCNGKRTTTTLDNDIICVVITAEVVTLYD